MVQVIKTVVAPITLACSIAVVPVDEARSDGFTSGISFSDNQDYYRLNIPTSLLVDDNAAMFLPQSFGVDIHTSNCLSGRVGYQWSGGNSNVGGVSWSVSTGAVARACSSLLSANFAPIKTYALDRIDTEVRNYISTEIGDALPPEFYSIASEYGVDPYNVIGVASTAISDYVLDPTRPVPDSERISEAFDRLPATGHPELERIRNEAREAALTFSDNVYELRNVIGEVNDFPSYVDGAGTMFSLGVENSARLRYHFAPQANVFVGANLNFTANVSVNDNPLPQYFSAGTAVVPFYGYEGEVNFGVEFADAIGDADLSLSAHFPYSKFEVPVAGVSITRSDSPYVSANLTGESGHSAYVRYTPERQQIGVGFNLVFSK